MAWPTDFFPCPAVYAFTSRKKARKFLKKKYDGELGDLIEGWEAVTVSRNTPKGAVIVIILELDSEKERSQRAAILAHESVHAAHAWASYMKDDEPSEEFVCYATQAVMLECLNQLGEEWL